MTGYRCDTGGCPQITYTGDTVTIVETANPEQVVVTAAAKWDAYLDKVRAPLAAEIERLRRDNERLSDTSLWDGGEWRVEYGQRDPDSDDIGYSDFWAQPHYERHSRDDVMRNVWLGPAQLLSGVSNTPDPDSDTQTTP